MLTVIAVYVLKFVLAPLGAVLLMLALSEALRPPDKKLSADAPSPPPTSRPR